MSVQQMGIKFHCFSVCKGKIVKVNNAVFKCDCGKHFITTTRNGKWIQSCGCLTAKLAYKKCYRHGLSRTKIYESWKGMIHRCCDDNRRDYASYKGKGITVCEEWYDLLKFVEDMSPMPENTTLDRIDNSKGYYKENCRWATSKEQCRNRRSNKFLTIDEITKTITEWSEHEDVTVSQSAILARLKRGWSAKEAVFAKDRLKTLITINGTTKCIIDWAAHEGVTAKPSTISKRLNNGWEPERAVFEEPSDRHRNTAYKQNKK